ncbi:amino acid permease [Candidimonas sp. SYP-B2681]|uniref:APC family permease n=1 Tax=Candidimonas sp. SYP-B2681 TaxID=2497686 RepID=UPI000F8809E3|nr:amino acid permease [Candidimonas sp. SYP-B2681]RTZ48003.1 amino acid permease [Candidimonas sp. SYP-B2681]
MTTDAASEIPTPKPQKGNLTVLDGVAVLVGVVIGIGIFGFPPLVAQYTDSPAVYMGLWAAGGLIMLAGALCYAELGSAYPSAGGEYHYLSRAWGLRIGLLFAWARCTVIQTGAIAAVAFIYGDYAQQLVGLGIHGSSIHAALGVMVMTALNIRGTRESKQMQLIFTTLTVAALGAVVLAGLWADTEPLVVTPVQNTANAGWLGGLGMGMVFVLLTYGGWNETAYLSSEMRNPARDLRRVLVVGCLIVTVVYLLINLTFLELFGIQGLRQSQAIGADVMRLTAGPYAAVALSILICCTAISTINGTIMTGARVYYALGRDLPCLRALGVWSARGQTPVRALLLQCAITLALILFGALSDNGVQAMVAYTAPVFWLFMMLVALSVWRLRRIDPGHVRPFKTPLYPFTPVLFALTCAGLMWASTLYAGAWAIVGLLVLLVGIPAIAFAQRVGISPSP